MRPTAPNRRDRGLPLPCFPEAVRSWSGLLRRPLRQSSRRATRLQQHALSPRQRAFRRTFFYQTTEPINNEPTGTPNTPVDIASGTGQTFLVAFIPSSDFNEEIVRLQFDCTNADPAPVIVGVDTLLLSASEIPIPDIVAASATINNDGIVNIPGQTASGVFAVATANVGVTGATTVSADTGSVTLPVSVFVCETNPATSVCLADPTPEVTTTIGSNKTPSFGVFVIGGGAVPFDPATNRIFVCFRDTLGVTRGSTSVAVRTAP